MIELPQMLRSGWVLSENVIESPVKAYLGGPVALTDNSNNNNNYKFTDVA